MEQASDVTTMEAHDAVVSSISSRVKHFHQLQKPFRIYHGATNSTRRSHRSSENTIDTSQLNHVLAVDAAAKTAVVEPNVPMDLLVSETLRHGLVPPVVMELPGITVGGGFSGTSGESSSFRYGAFDANINWIEIVLPDGEVVRASKTERQDLFWGAASAFGTLGVVTLLEVQLKEKQTSSLGIGTSGSSSDSVNVVTGVVRRVKLDDKVDGGNLKSFYQSVLHPFVSFRWQREYSHPNHEQQHQCR